MVSDVQFSLGSSSTTAENSGGVSAVDLSLDDMIKKRRKEQAVTTRKGASARKASVVDNVAGRGRAKRQAAINARRGFKPAAKASSMEIEREVYRQSRRTAQNKDSSLRKASGGRLPKKTTTPAARRRGTQQSQQPIGGKKKAGKQQTAVQSTPPAWVAGTRRPPSRKAVTAAVDAMSNHGFKVPSGMQMVISFAPAPNHDPTSTRKQNKPKKQANSNTNKNKGNGRKKK